jgi:hypothetical protein
MSGEVTGIAVVEGVTRRFLECPMGEDGVSDMFHADTLITISHITGTVTELSFAELLQLRGVKQRISEDLEKYQKL